MWSTQEMRRSSFRTASCVWLCAGLAGGLVACKSAAERKFEQESRTLSIVVRELRDAPHNAKQPGIERLRGLGCEHPRACQTQQVCLQAYTLHQSAMETTTELRRRLRDGAAIDRTAASELIEINERSLARARELMDECLELETGLVVDTR